MAGAIPERLREFRTGDLDLRSLLLATPGGEWYIARAGIALGDALDLEPQPVGIADARDLLPLDGYTLDGGPIDDKALKRAREHNNVVFEFSVQPPETAVDHRIRADTLGGLLSKVPRVVKYAYQDAVKKLSPAVRQSIDATDGHLMDVVATVPGSYRVVMEASQQPEQLNLSGDGELARGLRRLDEIFVAAGRPDASVATMSDILRGRLGESFIRLMSFLDAKQTGLDYSWASPNFGVAVTGGISCAGAGRLAKAFSGVIDLGVEQVTLVGEFELVSRKRSIWGLLTDNGIKTGVVAEGGPSLNGLEVGKRYRFNCQEKIELRNSSHKQSTLLLKSFEEVWDIRPNTEDVVKQLALHLVGFDEA